MLYRIDLEHFLMHCIDYFTRKELTSIKYLIISNNIQNLDKAPNVYRSASEYPSSEILTNYYTNNDLTLFKNEYLTELKIVKNCIYRDIIYPIAHHEPLFIIYRAKENFIIDILTEFLSEEYHIDCIDLNKLFINGEIDPIIYDHDKITETDKKINKELKKEWIETQEETSAGRKQLLSRMSSKNKEKLIKKLGYNTDKLKESEYDSILNDEWVKDSD